MSTLVGLLYGAMLPMFPRRPIVLGGLIVPVLWSGLLHPTLNLLNPLLASRIDWLWFVASQVAFGIVAGAVVVRQSPMPTLENVSFALRAGIEAPGTILAREERHGRDARSTALSSTVLVATLGVLLVGCGAPPGQPRAGSIALAPNDVVEFDALYADNCAGCHGANGRGGAAIALANPVYLAIVDDRSMRATIADGVRGTSMPAFAQRAGGMLTEKQIDALVERHPIALERARTRSAARIRLRTRRRPPATSQRGEAAYQTFCQSCHGADGRGGPKGSAITNDSFLALVSDQGLRTIVIAGRPELGAPDWRGYVAGRPMSDQEVTDVVSWLASHRVAAPGQPYVADRSASGASRVE